MSIYNRTALGFALVILLVVTIGIFSVLTVKSLTVETERLYKHPFTVSNAARDIDMNLVSMHRYMKDVVLSQNNAELEKAIGQVNQHEKNVFNSFNTIFERYLGNKEQILKVYQSFISWRDIRAEVIALKRMGKSDAAAQITKGKGARHVHLLSAQTHELVDFAANKATEFRDKSRNNERQGIIVLAVLSTLACVLSVTIAIYIIRRQAFAAEEIKKRSHLIDQNIMIAQLDIHGNVTSISNALCRFLEYLPDEIINTPSHFFIAPEYNDVDLEDSIWRVLKTGTQWQNEIKYITQSGYTKWAKLTVVPNVNKDYDIEGYTCLLQDMTSKKMSLTDNLTTLGNRRQYEDVLAHEIRLAKRNDSYLTLAILDIDFFKNYNDLYGHPQGDAALAQVSKAILSCMRRPNDFTFRIGGEEFAILFSSTGPDDARAFLDNIRHCVKVLEIAHAASKVSEFLTVSIGGTTLKGSAIRDGEHMYIDADKALYLAKETRNMTVMG
ncbi:MAG: diguanylate cyclase [Magnetovibrio sp.]|nr:diguanylate cyclase [Magnetovibrio sp.]